MQEHIYRELAKIEKKEARLFKDNPNLDIKILTKKIEAKIPPDFHAKLNSVFYQGFRLVFKSGTGVIEKTYNKNKTRDEYTVNNYAAKVLGSKQGLRRINLSAHKKHLSNLGIAAGEGGALGLLGIGLPDIPIFIGVLLKAVYETALSFGFDYEKEEEKYYILLLVEGALGNGPKKERLSPEIDAVAAKIDKGVVLNYDLDLQMRNTAEALSTDLLVMKFIQGLPIVGAVGSVTNAYYCNRVTDYAKLKYKKRYLLNKLDD
ncbi:MAG: EcsC family protein [Bacillota bacterium]|nr:EcsC family protein [Bacillota bacterium]